VSNPQFPVTLSNTTARPDMVRAVPTLVTVDATKGFLGVSNEFCPLPRRRLPDRDIVPRRRSTEGRDRGLIQRVGGEREHGKDQGYPEVG